MLDLEVRSEPRACARETLFGIVLSQIRKPGAPLIIGGLMSNMDMLTTVYCYGSPDMVLLSAAYTDITKWLGVPEYETAGCSDVKLFDEQAAMEASINIATAALIGGNMIHDVGYIEQGLTSWMEMLVASDEIIDMVKHVLRGIPVTDETMALDVIDEIGPGGHYREHDHTTRWKTELWRPKLINRQSRENWERAGSKAYQQRVRERVIEIRGALPGRDPGDSAAGADPGDLQHERLLVHLRLVPGLPAAGAGDDGGSSRGSGSW